MKRENYLVAGFTVESIRRKHHHHPHRGIVPQSLTFAPLPPYNHYWDMSNPQWKYQEHMEGRQLSGCPFAFAGTDTTASRIGIVSSHPTNVLVPVLHKHTKSSSNQLTMSDLHRGGGYMGKSGKKEQCGIFIFSFS
jgi:hypothetical protein